MLTTILAGSAHAEHDEDPATAEAEEAQAAEATPATDGASRIVRRGITGLPSEYQGLRLHHELEMKQHPFPSDELVAYRHAEYVQLGGAMPNLVMATVLIMTAGVAGTIDLTRPPEGSSIVTAAIVPGGFCIRFCIRFQPLPLQRSKKGPVGRLHETLADP